MYAFGENVGSESMFKTTESTKGFKITHGE